jgi:hypothetical protein
MTRQIEVIDYVRDTSAADVQAIVAVRQLRA